MEITNSKEEQSPTQLNGNSALPGDGPKVFTAPQVLHRSRISALKSASALGKSQLQVCLLGKLICPKEISCTQALSHNLPNECLEIGKAKSLQTIAEDICFEKANKDTSFAVCIQKKGEMSVGQGAADLVWRPMSLSWRLTSCAGEDAQRRPVENKGETKHLEEENGNFNPGVGEISCTLSVSGQEIPQQSVDTPLRLTANKSPPPINDLIRAMKFHSNPQTLLGY